MRQVLPKWQIATGVSTQRATLKPGSAPQKATLLTKNGPQDVSAIDQNHQDLLTYFSPLVELYHIWMRNPKES